MKKIVVLALFLINLVEINALNCEKLRQIKNEKLTKQKWEPVVGNLYINKYSDIGYKRNQIIDHPMIPHICSITEYSTHTFPNPTPLKEIIHLKSLIHLGGVFYKDKQHIYFYQSRSSGGALLIFNEVHHNTFEMITDYFVKDKDHIYTENGTKLQDVDYDTFMAKNQTGYYGKDKHGFFFWDERIPEEAINSVDASLLKELKELLK